MRDDVHQGRHVETTSKELQAEPHVNVAFDQLPVIPLLGILGGGQSRLCRFGWGTRPRRMSRRCRVTTRASSVELRSIF